MKPALAGERHLPKEPLIHCHKFTLSRSGNSCSQACNTSLCL